MHTQKKRIQTSFELETPQAQTGVSRAYEAKTFQPVVIDKSMLKDKNSQKDEFMGISIDSELTVEQVSHLLNICEVNVLKMLDEKKLPSKGNGKSRMIPARDAIEYKKNQDVIRRRVFRKMVQRDAEKFGLEDTYAFEND